MSVDQENVSSAVSELVRPLNSERYALLRHGIFETQGVDVLVNEQKDFAFLHPRPSMDYRHYKPRSQRLNLNPSRSGNAMQERLAKVAADLTRTGNFLEIGAAEAGFLKEVHKSFPQLDLACIEPDQDTRPQRDELVSLRQYRDADEVFADGARFDAVGLFHVFEHIEQPSTFLAQCAKMLAQGGRLIIEVPSLTDPLLSVYRIAAYEAFYFQQQHPFVYSAASLSRVLEQNGFTVEKVIPYQRYGLDNHLAWLRHGKPGGDENFRRMFSGLDGDYRAALERNGTTDTVIAVARMRP